MLGKSIVQTLLKQGVCVRAFVRPTSDVQTLQPLGVELLYGQVGELASICMAMQGVEMVFHVAGYVSANAPFETNTGQPLPEIYQRVNVDFTRILLETALDAGVKRFIHTSSASVYGLDVPIPTPETAVTRPGSHYGHSKLKAEQLVQAYNAKGLPTTIIRPSVIYGADDRHFLPSIRSLTNAPVVPLVNGGRNLLDLVFVRDVAQLMWVASQSRQAIGQIYNAGPGSPTSLRDFLWAYGKVVGKRPKIVSISAKMMGRLGKLAHPLAKRFNPAGADALSPKGIQLMTQDFFLDMTCAEKELGFRPQYSLVDGLRIALPQS